MSLLSHSGVDAVLQITNHYLSKVIIRQLYDMLPACLDTRGFPFPTGGTVIRADDVVFKIGDVTFRYDGSDTFVILRLEVLDGTLEAGSNAGNLQEVSSVDLEYLIFINTDETQDTRLVLEADVGIDDLRDLLEQLGEDVSGIPENDPQFVLDLAAIATGGVNLMLAQNPGAVKLLSDGTFAVGLNINRGTLPGSPQRDLATFRNQYDISHVSFASRDWSLTVDRWIIDAFIRNIDIAQGRSNLRNVSQELKRLTDTEIEIKGRGEGRKNTIVGDWWDFDFEADIDMEVQQGRVVANYTVTSVDPDSIFVTSSKVMEKLKERGQDTGTITIIPSAVFGEADDPGGQYFINGVDPDPGLLTFHGAGSVEQIFDPSIRIYPDDFILAPTCSGQRPSIQVTVSNPDLGIIPGEKMPLQICLPIGIEGPGANAFETTGVGANMARIEAGQSRQFTLRTLPSAMGSNHAATMVIRSNGGIKRLPLQAQLAPASLSGIPETLTLDARQRILACSFKKISEASEDFTISNVSSGAVTVCEIEIQHSGSGSWSWSGEQDDDVFGLEGELRPGYIMEPGDQKDLTVTFQNDELDEFESATLVIRTSAGTYRVDLQGRIQTASDDASFRGPDGGLLGYGGYGMNPTDFCFEFENFDKVIHFWDTIHDRFHDGWHRAKPDCCPPPQQPYCLCENFIELNIQGLPKQARFTAEFEDTYFELEHPEANPSVLLPFPREEGGRFRIETENGVEGSVRGRMRNWQFSRTGRWKSETPVTGLVTSGRSIFLLNEGKLKTFRIGHANEPKQHAEFAFEEQPADVARVGDHLIFPGKGSWQAGRIREGELELHAAIEFEPIQRLINPFCKPARMSNMVFGIAPGHILLIDVSQPEEPKVLDKQKTDAGASAGWIEDKMLYLSSRSGVEVFSIGEKKRLQRIGMNSAVQNVTSIASLGGILVAVHEKGNWSLLSSRPKEEFRQVGSFTPFGNWQEINPFGGFQPLGRKLVSVTPDQRGFNVIKTQIGSVENLK